MSRHLAGKRVLILGAETEIGRAVTTGVAEAGANVGAVAATSDAEAAFAVQRLARRLSSGDRKEIGQAIDATNEAAVRVMVRQVSKELGGLDAVVYCQRPMEQLTRDEVEGKPVDEIEIFMEERLKNYMEATHPISTHILDFGGRELDRAGGGPLVFVSQHRGMMLYSASDTPLPKWWLEEVSFSNKPMDRIVKDVIGAVRSRGLWWKAGKWTPRPLLPVYRFLARLLIRD